MTRLPLRSPPAAGEAPLRSDGTSPPPAAGPGRSARDSPSMPTPHLARAAPPPAHDPRAGRGPTTSSRCRNSRPSSSAAGGSISSKPSGTSPPAVATAATRRAATKTWGRTGQREPPTFSRGQLPCPPWTLPQAGRRCLELLQLRPPRRYVPYLQPQSGLQLIPRPGRCTLVLPATAMDREEGLRTPAGRLDLGSFAFLWGV